MGIVCSKTMSNSDTYITLTRIRYKRRGNSNNRNILKQTHFRLYNEHAILRRCIHIFILVFCYLFLSLNQEFTRKVLSVDSVYNYINFKNMISSPKVIISWVYSITL